MIFLQKKIMRLIFLILSFFVFYTTTIGQSGLNPCGAELSQRQKDWLRNYQQHPYPAASQRDENDPIYLKIQFHILGMDDGYGYFSESGVYDLLCSINEDFRPLGVQFYHPNPFNYIDKTEWYIHQEFGPGQEMMNESNFDNRINVYIVDNPAGNCGYFSWGGDAIAVSKSCSAEGSTTLTHELGHYFSLPHTFSGWEYSDEPFWNFENSENVARSGSNRNCNEAGDGFCDTPADYINSRWNCPYNGTLLDPVGDTLYIDGSFFMSYSSDECQDKFSLEQMDAIYANITEERDYLISNNLSVPAQDLVSVIPIFPAHQTSGLAPEPITLRWTSVEGASKYHVMITKTGGSSGLEYFTETDTFLTISLNPNTTYFWKVKPFHVGEYCAPYSAQKRFSTNADDDIIAVQNVNVVTPSCNGLLDGSITVELAGGAAPYNIQWQEDLAGQEGTTISNIGAGIYTAIVTDANNIEQEISVELGEPNNIAVSWDQIFNYEYELKEIDGGTPPYTYSWDGLSDEPIQLLEPGLHHIYVTDFKGCIDTTNVTVLGMATSIVNLLCAENNIGEIDVDSIYGGTAPYDIRWMWEFQEVSNTENLPSGVYYATIVDAEGVTATLSAEVGGPLPFNADVQVSGDNGHLTISGGSAPYQVIWSAGDINVNDVYTLPLGQNFVYIIDANGCEYQENFVVLYSGIQDIEGSGFSVFPNPSYQSNINIQTSKPLKNVHIALFNLLGQKVLEQTIDNNTTTFSIDTQQLSSGIYHLIITDQQDRYQTKIMLSK